jgi:hypothetical protein
VGEAVIVARGAGTTTGGAVGAGDGTTFFLQPVKANKATNSTTRDKIRIGRSNELLLQQKHERFSDALTIYQHLANATRLTAQTAAGHDRSGRDRSGKDQG